MTASKLIMLRPNLDELSPLVIPDGFSIRTFREGDGVAWDAIVSAAFSGENEKRFDSYMRRDPAFRPERVLFLCRGEQPVGTIAGWVREDDGPRVGRLHMLALVPRYQRRGLGKVLAAAVLQAMRREGFNAARLVTDDSRLSAIKTYLQVGFIPQLVDAGHLPRWRRIAAQLSIDGLDQMIAV